MAPLIANVAMLTLVLAWLYFSGGLDIFGNTVVGVEAGMQATIEAAPEELAAGMCMAESRNRTTKQLIAEECEFIDEQGREVSNAVMAKVMKDMVSELQERMGESKALITTVSVDDGDVTRTSNVHEVMSTNFDQTYKALMMAEAEARDASFAKGALDLGAKSGMDGYQAKWAKILQARITDVQNSGEVLPAVSDDEMQALANSIQTSYHVESLLEDTYESSAKGTAKTFYEYGKTQLKGITMTKEGLLAENQIKRLKKLAGV